MLPGTEYTPERIAQAFRRRAWLLVVTPLIGLTAAILISRRLPDLYRSETVIMLEPQRISDEYVKSMAPAAGNDRVATMENEIRSRSRLERIITDLNLYPSLRQTAPMQDVVEQMNGDIAVDTDKASVSVRVSYVSRDPKTAQQVAERLSSSFIQETMRDRATLAQDTNSFLDAQLEDAKRQLIEHEKKLERYRTQYGQELPSQSTTNLQAVQSSQTQLQASLDASARTRERRLMLQRQLADLEAEVTPEEPVVASPEPGKGTTAEQLAAARAQLAVLLTRAKPDHPDVKAVRRTIRDLEAKLAAENADGASKSAAARRPTANELQRQRRLRDLKDQIADTDNELADRQRQEARLRSVIGGYQANLNAIPKRESELVELSRDYATLQATYQGLLSKRQDAKIAADLERRNIGPQFRILDSPKVPERPFTPNRPLIDLGGACAGLLLGVVLVAFAEVRDGTLRSEEDVERILQLPVLAVMPVMAAPRMRASFVVAGIAAVAAVAAAVALWTGSVHLSF